VHLFASPAIRLTKLMLLNRTISTSQPTAAEGLSTAPRVEAERELRVILSHPRSHTKVDLRVAIFLPPHVRELLEPLGR
jgi:hypothetical protein